MTAIMFFSQHLIYRSNRSQVLYAIGILENFAELTGKPLCKRLFGIKLHDSTPAILLKMRWDTGVLQ